MRTGDTNPVKVVCYPRVKFLTDAILTRPRAIPTLHGSCGVYKPRENVVF